MNADEFARKQDDPLGRQGEGRAKNSTGGVFQDLFAEGVSIWIKVLGGAFATPTIVYALIRKTLRRQARSGGETFSLDTPTLVLILVCCAVGGALLGAALSIKDIVQRRMAAGASVPFPLKLVFGWGIWSVLLFWVPLAIFGTLVVSIMTL